MGICSLRNEAGSDITQWLAIARTDLAPASNIMYGEEERFLSRDEQGMVVCYLAVIHAAACRDGFCPHLVFPFGLRADKGEQLGDFSEHVFGDVAASRSRIGYQLLLVELLRDFKRLFRREAVLGVGLDRKSTRLNSSHSQQSRMPSSA